MRAQRKKRMATRLGARRHSIACELALNLVGFHSVSLASEYAIRDDLSTVGQWPTPETCDAAGMAG